ncbi:MAG TPA: hypothetical protein VFT72_05050 [Opitutaceae bacterium]|nr:hypothetical protein [Opitutaceae bacterium]
MDTLASVVWAATRGDVSSLAPAIAFDREGRKNAEAIFSQLPSSVQRQYGTLENVYATLVAASIPLGLSDAQIVREQTEPNGDRGLTLKLVRENGSTHESSFRFRLSGSSWQLVVPNKIVANFSRALVSPQGSGNHKVL